jgi:hypothetical protein
MTNYYVKPTTLLITSYKVRYTNKQITCSINIRQGFFWDIFSWMVGSITCVGVVLGKKLSCFWAASVD